jgi:hypothetical protein
LAYQFWNTNGKLARAKKHIDDLILLHNQFVRADPPPYRFVYEPSGSETLLRVRIDAPIPNEFNMIVGDAIHNLRAALDYSISELLHATTGQSPGKQHAFPIVDHASKLQDEIPRRLAGLSLEVFDAVRGCEPFKGSGNVLWQLHELDNRDKHRLLLTAATAITEEEWGDAPPGGDDPSASIQTTCNPVQHRESPTFGTSLNDGEVIRRLGPDEVFQKHYSIQLAINEPGVLEGAHAVPWLLHAGQFVREVAIFLSSYAD